MPLRVAVALVVIVLFVLFGAQNTEPVGVRLFFWQITTPAAVAVVGAFACGVIVGILLLWNEQRRAQRQRLAAPGQSVPPAKTAMPAKKKERWWW
jgi:uncharacterized integral membrane protein